MYHQEAFCHQMHHQGMSVVVHHLYVVAHHLMSPAFKCHHLVTPHKTYYHLIHHQEMYQYKILPPPKLYHPIFHHQMYHLKMYHQQYKTAVTLTLPSKDLVLNNLNRVYHLSPIQNLDYNHQYNLAWLIPFLLGSLCYLQIVYFSQILARKIANHIQVLCCKVPTKR